jgi:hypothetical protein
VKRKSFISKKTSKNNKKFFEEKKERAILQAIDVGS